MLQVYTHCNTGHSHPFTIAMNSQSECSCLRPCQVIIFVGSIPWQCNYCDVSFGNIHGPVVEAWISSLRIHFQQQVFFLSKIITSICYVIQTSITQEMHLLVDQVEKDCRLLTFTVVAMNEAGNSTGSTILESIPLSKITRCSTTHYSTL